MTARVAVTSRFAWSGCRTAAAYLTGPPPERTHGRRESQVEELLATLREEPARNTVVAIGEPECLLAVLVFRRFGFRECPGADPPHVGGVKALDVRRAGAEERGIVARGAVLRQRREERTIGGAVLFGTEEVFHDAPHVGKPDLAAFAQALMPLGDRPGREACLPNHRPEGVGVSVNEFGAELDRQRGAGGADRVHPSADPVTRLDKRHVPAGSGEPPRRRQAGDARADDEDIGGATRIGAPRWGRGSPPGGRARCRRTGQ